MKLLIALCMLLSFATAQPRPVENNDMSGYERLQQYEASVISSGVDSMTDALDMIQTYIEENQAALGILRFSRSDDSIYVKFDDGIGYMVMPRLDEGVNSVE